MFNFFKKTKEISLYSPCDGTVLVIEDVPDAVFSSKAMGEGYAVFPESGDVYSPCEGKITSIFPTKHAVGIEMEGGLEVLVHMGIDTVELKGKGFNILIQEGDKVDQSTKIAEMNIGILESNGKNPTIMVVFPNINDKEINVNCGKSKKQDKIGKLV